MTSAPQPLPIGFIGGGCNSAIGRSHAIACQMDNRWRLVAGCFSRDQACNTSTGLEWHIAPQRIYQDWREFLDREKDKVSAVAILTPTPEHAEMVTTALSLGVPVICEKALCASVADALSIGTALERSGTPLAVTYNYTGYPIVRELRQLISSGSLGRILHIQAEMPQEPYLRTDKNGRPFSPQAWRLQDYALPAISLDLGTHLLHLIRFLTGARACEVSADYKTFGRFKEIIDDVTCWVRYDTGMRASVWFSKSAIGYRNGLRIRIFGERASAEWYQMNPEELRIDHAHGVREIIDRGGDTIVARQDRYSRFKSGHPAGFVEAFANLYTDIADHLQQRTKGASRNNPFVPSFEDALEGLQILDAAHRSSKSGRWQTVAALPQKRAAVSAAAHEPVVETLV